jgi:hypothetical protein
MNGFAEQDLLERQLGALADLIDIDARHHLVADVLARLDAPVRRQPFVGPRRRVVLIVGVLAAVIIAAVVVLPGPRRTVAHWFGIGSTRIDVRPSSTSTSISASTGAVPPTAGSGVESPPSVAVEPTVPVTFPADLRLGRSTTAVDAEARTGLTVALAPSLGEPQGIFVVSPPASGQVVVVYPPSELLPVSAVAGVGALLSTMPGTINDGLFVKIAGPAESFMLTTGTGAVVDAIWLGGAPHDYVFEDVGGAPVFDTLRLATHTLLWQDGSVTHRLEAELTRDEAVRIAGTVVSG